MDTVKLPELPEAVTVVSVTVNKPGQKARAAWLKPTGHYYTIGTLQAYARAAVEASKAEADASDLLPVLDLLRTDRNGKKWDYVQSHSGSMVNVSRFFAPPAPKTGPVEAQAGLVCVGWQWNDARDKLGWLELHLPPHKNPRPEPHMKYRRIYAGPVEGGKP